MGGNGMYTQQDDAAIAARLKKSWILTLGVLAVLIAVYVLGMIFRWQIAVMVFGCLIFGWITFMIIEYLWPSIRYRNFLRDMRAGLSREMTGTVVEISEQTELKDGVQVQPVRILLDDEQDERIIYLNRDKQDLFPKAGEHVHVNCFGRHIREVLD